MNNSYTYNILARFWFIWLALLVVVGTLHITGPGYTNPDLEQKLQQSFNNIQAVVPNNINAKCDWRGTQYLWDISTSHNTYKKVKLYDHTKTCTAPSSTMLTYSGTRWANAGEPVYQVNTQGQEPPLLNQSAAELSNIWHTMSKQIQHTSETGHDTAYANNIQAFSIIQFVLEAILVIVSLLVIELSTDYFKSQQRKRYKALIATATVAGCTGLMICMVLPFQMPPENHYTHHASQIDSILKQAYVPHWTLQSLTVSCIGGKMQGSSIYTLNAKPSIKEQYLFTANTRCAMLPHSEALTLQIKAQSSLTLKPHNTNTPELSYDSAFLQGSSSANYSIVKYHWHDFTQTNLEIMAKQSKQLHSIQAKHYLDQLPLLPHSELPIE